MTPTSDTPTVEPEASTIEPIAEPETAPREIEAIAIAGEDHQLPVGDGVVNVSRGCFVVTYADGSFEAMPPAVFADVFAGASIAVTA